MISIAARRNARSWGSLVLLLVATACAEDRGPAPEIVDRFFADFKMLNKSCDLANVGFDPIVEGAYRNGEIPHRSQIVSFFSFDAISDEQNKCVQSFRGAHGYRFKVIQYDPSFHSDA